MTEQTLRREFILPGDDVEHLDARQLPWETVLDGRGHWLLIHGFPLPKGYTVSTTTAAIRIESGYPTAPLDMVYFRPALSLQNGKTIGALSSQRIADEDYQRWSRHRSETNPWRPGLDNISTHLGLVEEWLLREVVNG